MGQTALRIVHGPFGRMVVLRLGRTLISHAHRHCHLIYKCGGPDITFGVREKEYPLNDKSVILINSWEPHFYSHKLESNNILMLALYVEPDWLRKIDRRLSSSFNRNFFNAPMGVLSPRTMQLRDDIFHLLMYDVEADSSKIESLFYDLVISTIDAFAAWRDSSRLDQDSLAAGDRRIRRVLTSIKENDGFGVDTEMLVAESGLSRAHFFELFKNQTGVTPHIYANSIRLETAINLIIGNDIKLNKISDDLEFGSQAEFTSFFKRQIGIPPSHYRRVSEIIAASEDKSTLFK